ncbi:MAG TPA: phosphoglycerate mutase family protein [Gemmatimonadales bacterium]
MMRIPYLLLAACALPACAAGQGTPSPSPRPTIVILARHAEKASETETDPSLSARGRERAAALGKTLADARLTGVIVSERRRTHETAAPAAGAIVPDTARIAGGVADHARSVADLIRTRHAGGTVLVVGHSNTIPRVMTELGAGPLPDICDAAYADLYIMILDGVAAPRVIRASYGPADPPGAGDCPGMQAR